MAYIKLLRHLLAYIKFQGAMKVLNGIIGVNTVNQGFVRSANYSQVDENAFDDAENNIELAVSRAPP